MPTKQSAKFEMYHPPIEQLILDVEPITDDYFIFWLFDHKCAVCGDDGDTIAEIWAEHRDWVNNWKSRVLLCDWHKNNYMKTRTHATMMEMTEIRKQFLMEIGRDKYAR